MKKPNKMKHIFSMIIMIGILLSACEPLDPLKEYYDEVGETPIQLNDFKYALTDEDFDIIADRALQENPGDTDNVEFLRNNQYFTDSIPAAEYVPYVMDDLFPALDPGSSAKVAYGYSTGMPEELSHIANQEEYAFSGEDYEAIDSSVGYLGYLSPPYEPSSYIPKILENNVERESLGDTIVVVYQYTDNYTRVDFTKAIRPEYAEVFNTDKGRFSMVSKDGSQAWEYRVSGNGTMSINGYDGQNYNDNEDWLISPSIDLTQISNAHLQFKHAVEYYESGSLFLMVSPNYNGNNLAEASWSQFEVEDPASTSINDLKKSGLINLSAFDGQTIHFAFKYVSSEISQEAPFWAISEVSIGHYGYKITGGGTPYQRMDYYANEGDSWIPLQNVHKLNSKDYASLGAPGENNHFSRNVPASDYLADFTANTYALAENGEERYYVYDYYNGESTISLADKLFKTDTGWISSYGYIEMVTEPYAKSTTGWAFDPTVNFTMTDADYRIIVNHVKNTPELDEKDPSVYDESEYYFGSTYYYDNFDARPGNQHESFDSWQEAVKTAISEVLLPAKFPDAQTHFKGIQMYYNVTFATYDGSDNTFTYKFKVTKSAPNPEFEFVEEI